MTYESAYAFRQALLDRIRAEAERGNIPFCSPSPARRLRTLPRQVAESRARASMDAELMGPPDVDARQRT